MAEKAFTFAADKKVNVLHCPIAISVASITSPKVDFKEYTAIWDTGATNSVITKKIAEELGLKPIGMTQSHTAGGLRDCNLYMIDVMLPNGIQISTVQVTEAPLVGFDVLIGMDIIGLGDFAVSTHDGDKTLVSFRIPSDGPVDFVAMQKASDEKAAVKADHKKLKAKHKQQRQAKKQSRKRNK